MPELLALGGATHMQTCESSVKSFHRRAATYSVVAPLVAVVLNLLQTLASARWAMVGMGMTATLLILSALVLGVISLRPARRDHIRRIFFWSLTGICISGLLILAGLASIPSAIRQAEQKKAFLRQ